MLTLTLARPLGFHDTVTETSFHFVGVRTILAVNLDTTVDGNESEHIVAVNRVAAFSQLEIKSFQILVDDEYIILEALVVLRTLDAITFSASVQYLVGGFAFLLLHFYELVHYLVGIELFIGDVLIEFGNDFVSQLLDESHHHRFIVIHLTVLELTFDGFLGKLSLMRFELFQCLTNLGACLRGGYNVQPIALRCLCVRSHDFHLVATVQFMS